VRKLLGPVGEWASQLVSVAVGMGDGVLGERHRPVSECTPCQQLQMCRSSARVPVVPRER